MSSENHTELRDLLALDPLVAETITFPAFLHSLKEHPERADTAAALFVRAVREGGEVDIDSLPEFRQPYHRMLAAMGIPAYRRFDRVRGSHRIVYKVLKHYEAAAQNGYQIRQMLILFGGPGSGKSFLVDHMIGAEEGQIVYAVKGCPVHENPLNLLRLLKKEQLESLSKELGLGETLKELMHSSLQPCPICFQNVMGVNRQPAAGKACGTGGDEAAHSHDEADPQPNLSNVEVQALRLSSRHAGISVWSPSPPGQGCSLKDALLQGSRGITRMSEAFAASSGEDGHVTELQVLLEATEGRRVPGGSCEKITGFIPLDTLIVAETNEDAFTRFVEEQPDPDAFTRRSRIVTVDYNTIRSEEEQAYLDFIAILKQVPDYDPLAWRMAATLAVASRMGEDGEVDTMTKIRMYDGERLNVPKKTSRVNPRASEWGTSMFGGGSSGKRSATDEGEDGRNVTVGDLWERIAEAEGKRGLNMGFMLSSVSQICELGLNTKHRCVTALGVIKYLRARIEAQSRTPGLTDNEKAILTRCREFLKEPQTVEADPGLVEREYRRLLRNQLLAVFAPDFDSRAEEDFQRYCLHAGASAKGHKKVHDPGKKKEVLVDDDFLVSLERWMGLTGSDEREQFRRSVDARINHILRQKAQESDDGDEALKDVEINWQLIPELARAIRNRLNDEIAKKIEKIVTSSPADLNEDQVKMRKEALERFQALGYSQECLTQALNYAKDHKLWEAPQS